MDATKEFLIEKLLKEGKITKDDANVLRRGERVIDYIREPPHQYPFPEIMKPKSWIEQEMDNRARIVENCGCNPANGGSGVCGCTLSGPIITC